MKRSSRPPMTAAHRSRIFRAKHRTEYNTRNRARNHRRNHGEYILLDHCERCHANGSTKLIGHHAEFQYCVRCNAGERGYGTCPIKEHQQTLCGGCHNSLHRRAAGRAKADARALIDEFKRRIDSI